MTTPLTQSSSAAGGRQRVKYVRRLDQVAEIPADVRARLQPVTEEYVFRANDYYLGLIDWNDPDDPIRQLIIPREEELSDWGRLDASNEQAVTVARGVQHKYFDTVLLLCNEVCGAYCRYCFRKRLFMDDNDEVTNDVSAGLAYIAAHPEVSNVLLTGGDPLLMSTRPARRDLRGPARHRPRPHHPHRIEDAGVRPVARAPGRRAAGRLPQVLDAGTPHLPDGALRPPRAS